MSPHTLCEASSLDRGPGSRFQRQSLSRAELCQQKHLLLRGFELSLPLMICRRIWTPDFKGLVFSAATLTLNLRLVSSNLVTAFDLL